jgi:hypothetical protein
VPGFARVRLSGSRLGVSWVVSLAYSPGVTLLQGSFLWVLILGGVAQLVRAHDS